ncbi:MAG: hypothetical protein HFI08_04630 [Bacilli bacterium]|jgi:hypothetical protein|nr:hypothetical protein [Bacilli bacterium]
MNYKNIFKRETKVIAIVVICLTIVVIGASYAMFLQVDKNTDNQVVETGSLVITYTNANGETISESDIVSSNSCLDPMSDDDASILTDCTYKLNILNRGTLPASYRLVMYNNKNKLPKGGTFVDHSLIRIGLKKGNETLAPMPNKTLSEITHTTETEGVTAQNDIRYVLDEGVLEANQDISYSVQAWINEELATSAVSGQYIYLKLEVSGVVSEETPITNDSNSGATLNS